MDKAVQNFDRLGSIEVQEVHYLVQERANSFALQLGTVNSSAVKTCHTHMQTNFLLPTEMLERMKARSSTIPAGTNSTKKEQERTCTANVLLCEASTHDISSKGVLGLVMHREVGSTRGHSLHAQLQLMELLAVHKTAALHA
jgi:hypothetical protein